MVSTGTRLNPEYDEESMDEPDLERRRRRKPAARGGNRERSNGDSGGNPEASGERVEPERRRQRKDADVTRKRDSRSHVVPTAVSPGVTFSSEGASGDRMYERLVDDEPRLEDDYASQTPNEHTTLRPAHGVWTDPSRVDTHRTRGRVGRAEHLRTQSGGNPAKTRPYRYSDDYGEAEETDTIRVNSTDNNDDGKYYKPLTLRARLTAALTADADELRFQLEELHAVRQIMIEGNPQMVARLMLQLHHGFLSMHHPWLHDHMQKKLASVQRGRGKVVLDQDELGSLEEEMWPTAHPGAVDRAMGLERIVNTYCRASTAGIMAMGIEIAKIKNVLAMKEALSLKLLGLAGSVVYLFGQWLFNGPESDDGFAGSHA